MRSYKLLIALLCIAFAASASLRVRYCYPPNHDPNASTYATEEMMDTVWWSKINPGAWDGYDEQNGFDGVADDDLGSFDEAPYVSGSWWIDSIFAPYTDAALVDGAATEYDLLDSTYVLGLDAYFLLAYGAITLPEDGEYELFGCSGDAGLTYWIDFNQDGVIDDADLQGSDKNDTTGLSLAPPGTPNGYVFDHARYSKVTADAGTYRIMIWNWDHSQVSYAGLFWRTPGSDEIVPVPASAFGMRRNIGVPRVSITRVLVNGESVPENDWGSIDIAPDDTVTFHTTAINMGDHEPVFIWDFNDGSDTHETADSVVSHVFSQAPPIGFYSPGVQVQRGSVVSERALESVFLWPTTSVLGYRHGRAHGLVRVQGTTIRVDERAAAGRIHITRANGATARTFRLEEVARHGAISLDKLGLAPGYYVVRVHPTAGATVSQPVILGR